MFFEAFARRIISFMIAKIEIKQETKQLTENRLQVICNYMKTTSIKKYQFLHLIDKIFYFADGTLSLPLGHVTHTLKS